MLPVDPAEALLASIGVRPIISHKIERITPDQWKDAANVQHIADGIAKDMCAGKLDDLTVLDFERIDYSQTLRDLSTPYVPAQVEAMLTHIPNELEGLHAGFIALAQKTFAYLYSQFPIALRNSVAGSNNLMPPRRLVSRFESLLWVLDNPMGVFNLMQNATLTQQQTEGLRAVYPTLCRHIENDSIPDAIEDARIGNSKFQLQRRTEQGVRRFLGRVNLPPELAMMLQAQPDAQKTGPQPEAKASGVLSKETAPKTRRIEQGAET